MIARIGQPQALNFPIPFVDKHHFRRVYRMSNTNQEDWRVPLATGTYSPAQGTVSRSTRTISVRSPFGEMQEVTEEWIIPGIGPVPAPDSTINTADTPPETPSSAPSAPKSYTKPVWATLIDEGLIHTERYTTKIPRFDPILASSLADAQSQPDVSKHSITIPTPKGGIKLEIKESSVKTPPIPDPTPSTYSKQVGVKTPPSTPGPPPNPPSQRSIGTQTCEKATHLPSHLAPPNCAFPTNKTVKFVDSVEVIPHDSFDPGTSATKEHKRPPFHRPPTPANILDLVQEIQVPKRIAIQLRLSKDGTIPPPSRAQPSMPKKRDEGVIERGVKTPWASPGAPSNSPSKRLIKDGLPPPPRSVPPNRSAKKAGEVIEFSKDGTPPPSVPLNSPSMELSNDPPNTPTNESPKGDREGKTPSPPSPPPNSPRKEFDKGGGGGETPPPPSPPPNSPNNKLGKDGTPPPSPPPNSPAKRLSRPGTPCLALIIPTGDSEPHNPAQPKPVADGSYRPSPMNYTSNDDYPSPNPGTDSPITPLWLEMKNMVDKFIFKAEEENSNRNIAKRPESTSLPPSELNSPISPPPEAQSPSPSFTPRMLASLKNVTITVRVDGQGRASVGLNGGAGP